MLIDFRKLFPKYGIKPSGVLHVGANVGEEAPVYDELGIKKVIWFEANPELLTSLGANLMPYPGQTVYIQCVGDENKDIVLHVSNNSSQSSSILDLGTHKAAHPEVHYIKEIPVKMQRIDEMVASGWVRLRDVDFLNVDVQGAELKVLKGMGELLHDFKWAYLEVNKEELYKGCALVGEIDAYMAEFGFKRVETKWCGNTGWGDALFIK